MNLILWLFGYGEVRIPVACSACVLDLAYRARLPFSNFGVNENREVRLRLSILDARRLLRLAEQAGILLETTDGGLPRYLSGLQRRVGLWLGGLVAIALILLSRQFVWSVEVRGNDAMTPGEVEAELRACGFGVGSYIPGVRMGGLETEVLLASERISWISVHMEGTVAMVQIIERVPTPAVATRPANLVARTDGQIEQIELYRGNCLVSVGQAVRRGDLLVGGVYDGQNAGVRFTRAAGRILARTSHELSLEVPLACQQKIYTSESIDEIWINFFGFSLKIFKNSRNQGVECDIIKTEFGNPLLGGHRLPVGISVYRCHAYEMRAVRRTAAEAETMAYEMLAEQLSTFSANAELLKKEISFSHEEDAFRLACRIECIENIAEQAEFDVVVEP